MCQLTGAAVGAVAADDHQRVNAQLTALCSALILTLLGLELQAAGRIQDGATGRDDIGNAAQVHFKALAVQQAIVAALNADHTEALHGQRRELQHSYPERRRRWSAHQSF